MKNKGEGKWYRVEYDPVPEKVEEMTEKDKRKKEKNYVSKNKSKLISTSIANTRHIKKIITKHVKNPDPETIQERIREWHYKRDWQPESWDWFHFLYKKIK